MPPARAFGQMLLMAVIIATMLYFPAVLVIAGLTWPFGIPFGRLATLGGSVPWFAGAAAGWLLMFLAAAVYAVFVFPWQETTLGFKLPARVGAGAQRKE